MTRLLGSLFRVARRDLQRSRQIALWRRAGLRISRVLNSFFEWNFVRLGFIVFAGLALVVLPRAFEFLPVLGWVVALEESDRDEFLQVLWQVEAAVLALTFAVVLFAFQAMAGKTEGRVSLREFASRTNLLLMVDVGMAVLLIQGGVLLSEGSDGISVWRMTVAIWSSVFAFMSPPLLLWNTLQVFDSWDLQEERAREVVALAAQAVDEARLEQLATQRLSDLSQRLNIQFTPLGLPQTAPGQTLIRASRPGTVQDVRLRLLRLFVRSFRAGVRPQVSVRGNIGTRVGQNTVVMALPPGSSGWQRRLARMVFKIG